MASDTRNVKLGVCRVFFDGYDLGYTKGGVEVEVTTETYKVQVDQFGQSPINETVLGREVKVTVPMAETTVENMVRVMPGASLVQTGGAKASGTVTIATQPTANQTVIINGVTFTFKSAAATGDYDVLIGAAATNTVDNLRAKLNASVDPAVALADYSGTGTAMTVTYVDFGTEGNNFTLAAGTSGATVSGATLSGGMNPTAKRVDVNDGVGVNLLAVAKELRLHPKGLLVSDKSEDFVIPLAATAGGLQFAYRLDEERVYNVEFMGYPDSANNGKIFHFGS